MGRSRRCSQMRSLGGGRVFRHHVQLLLKSKTADFFVVHVEIIGSPNKERSEGRWARSTARAAQQCLSSNFLPKLKGWLCRQTK